MIKPMQQRENTPAALARFPLRRFSSFAAMKAEEYAYWQRQPAHVRLNAVAEITDEAYGLKGAPHVSRLQRVVVCLKR
jgi:hypothetical protein